MSEGQLFAMDALKKALQARDRAKATTIALQWTRSKLSEIFVDIATYNIDCDILEWFITTFAIDLHYGISDFTVVAQFVALQRWKVVQMMLELGAPIEHAWRGYQSLYRFKPENFKIRDMIVGYEIRELECAKAAVAMLSLGRKRHVLYNDVAWLIACEIWKTRRRDDWHGDRFHLKKEK